MDLFESDPVFTGSSTTVKKKPLRNLHGQFATPQQVRTERAEHENSILRRKAEQFKRAWLSVSHDNIRLTRELHSLKLKLKELINGTAKK